MIKRGMKKDLFSWIEKVIISLAVVGLIFWVNRFLPTKALIKRIYPTHCFGEWFGTEKVLGQPNVSEKGETTEFNSENSAFYQTGFKTLICQGFERAEGKFISAKLGFSLAIGEIPKEPEKPIKEIELEQPVKKEEPEKKELEEPGQPEQPEQLEQPEEPEQPIEPISLNHKFNDFVFDSFKFNRLFAAVKKVIGRKILKILPIFAQEPEENTSTPIFLPEIKEKETASPDGSHPEKIQEETIPQELTLPKEPILPPADVLSEETTSTPEIVPSPDVIFNLRYFLDEKPYNLSTFSSYPISNATNNGYFYFDLPEVKSLSDLEKLKISFEGLLDGDPHLTVYLDSVWLEVEYEEKQPLKVFQEFDGNDWEIFAESEDKKFQLTNNDFDDKFPSTDGESVVWQGQIDSRWQIFYLNFNDFLAGKKEITQITQTEYNNISPKVFERKIVWQAWLDNNWEIMATEKNEKGSWENERITTDQNHDVSPDFSHGAIIWRKKIDQETKIFKAIKTENQWQISSEDEKW